MTDPARALTLGFVDNPLNRHSEQRDDAQAMAAWLADADARTLVLAGDLPVLMPQSALSGRAGAQARFALTQAAAFGTPLNTFFMGTDEGGPLFATQIDAALAEPLKAQGFGVTDMRTIAVRGLAAPADVAALGMAKALMAWHDTHRFCAKCGAPSAVASAGWRRDCPTCKAQHFPRTDPVVIMLAHHGDQCLLGRSPRFPTPMYSALAGFMEPGETIEDAVRREILEESAIVCGRVDYCLSQPWPFPMSLMIGCLAQAQTSAITFDRTELLDARWFSRDETLALLENRHPEGLNCPTPISIAHQLMRQWVARF
ncbi:MAG: NAD(+) diphosphatase [Beijerinckiaceae bacterium]